MKEIESPITLFSMFAFIIKRGSIANTEISFQHLYETIERHILAYRSIQQCQILNIDVFDWIYKIHGEFGYHKPQFAYSESSIATTSAKSSPQ